MLKSFTARLAYMHRFLMEHGHGKCYRIARQYFLQDDIFANFADELRFTKI